MENAHVEIPTSNVPFLRLLSQYLTSLELTCSPTAQAKAATAQVQRRKWKMLMSRFRRRMSRFLGSCHNTSPPWNSLAHPQLRLKQQQLRSKDGNGKCSCRDSDVECPVS